ncbi:uncharacterized protein F4822DRAFT_198369 [Hypoxylon trugodes]|uniref:uncharacterized protein n=1 Tax=Hypoxylon trugodes TaxID=326681 RepID=UPI002195D509|nr:uncharacterized protein F4822DRAFT_198369 [Hypoxylon trugodes]KAI1389363.1 hypothetical protein F4822DRAFT_198369 [Hypoxylon trugodes]
MQLTMHQPDRYGCGCGCLGTVGGVVPLVGFLPFFHSNIAECFHYLSGISLSRLMLATMLVVLTSVRSSAAVITYK